MLNLAFILNAVADPQSLLEEKEALEEKLALSEYELRLVKEDVTKLKTEVEKKNDLPIDKLSGKFTFTRYQRIWFIFQMFHFLHL